MVHLQSCHGRSTDGRATDDAQTVARPCEVVLPNINARIEQRHGFASFWVCRRNEVSFVPMTCRATQPKICEAGRATQRARLDVFQFQPHRQELLRNQAVAAPLPGVAFHLPSQGDLRAFGHRLALLGQLIEDARGLRFASHQFMHIHQQLVE